MSTSKEINEKYPFISVIQYATVEYVGIIINQDQFITSFLDYGELRTPQEKKLFLEFGECWWWESNRMIPITIFLKNEMSLFKYISKSLNTKDVTILLGPTVNLHNISLKRVKRKTVQLIRKVR
jgi:hypothetical protein